MNGYDNIADKIIATYEKNIDDLGNFQKFHWLVRRFRTSGNKYFLGPIYRAFLNIRPKILKNIKALDSAENITIRSNEILLTYKAKTIHKRSALRIEFYQKNKLIPIYLHTLYYLFTLKSLGLEKSMGIREYYTTGINYYKNNDVSAIFLDPDFVRIYPSGSANMINFMAFLGISDNRKKLLDISKAYWQGIEPESHDIWLDKIYALTHLVIAGSAYYQELVKREDYDWIFNYFENNFDNIMQNCSTDAVTEMGLCFKLIGDPDNIFVTRVKDYLITSFNEKLGYIAKKKKAGISIAEHRNILAVMVLKDFEKLYKGPILRDII